MPEMLSSDYKQKNKIFFFPGQDFLDLGSVGEALPGFSTEESEFVHLHQKLSCMYSPITPKTDPHWARLRMNRIAALVI